jgi:hypothetical protein
MNTLKIRAARPIGAGTVRCWLLLLLVCAGFAMPEHAAAQPVSGQPAASDTLYEMRRPDGTRVVGWVLERTPETISFETIAGERIQVAPRLVDLRPARGRIVNGEFWREDANHSRLLFAPTGRTLHANQGYVGVFLVLPFIGYGFSDDFTFAGGIPFVGGTLAQTPFWIAPKLRIQNRPDRQVSVGAFLFHVPGWSDSGWTDSEDPDPRASDDVRWLGIGYGVGTFGDTDRALHVGLGGAFTDSGAGPYLPMMLGGEYRFGRRSKWITENWWVPGEVGLSSVGVRLIRTSWTTDLGLMFVLSEQDVPFFPVISFSYAFGSGR